MSETVSRRSLLLSAFANPVRRPNIVYVLVDQWRAQAFGYRGDKNEEHEHENGRRQNVDEPGHGHPFKVFTAVTHSG